MTLLVVLILFVLWAAVLGPRIVRRLRERGPDGSVDSFYHELHLLDRAAPKTVTPANRLETAFGGVPTPGASGYPSVSSMPGRPSLVLLPPVRSDDAAGPVARAGSGVPANRTLAARDRAYRVRQSRRRRRDVLLVLLAVAAGTGLLGTTHSFRFLWDLTVLSAVLLVVYLGLAVRAAQMAEAARYRPAPAGRPATARRAMAPRYAEEDAYGYGPDYEYGYADDDRATAVSARSGFPGAWDDEGYAPPGRVAAAGI